MQDGYFTLIDRLCAGLSGREVLCSTFEGEDSDFVRFNQGAVRQAGHVRQGSVGLELIVGARHARAQFSLAGDPEGDWERATAVLRRLRDSLPHLPDDPYLLYSQDLQNTESVKPKALPSREEVVDAVVAAGESRDFVGIYAAGDIGAGFANSLGQRNWFRCSSFHLDWSLYHQKDKAVKCGYADFQWDPQLFERKLASADEQLAILSRPARTIDPGRYRVYLAPAALSELVGLLGWGGFGLKDHMTKQSPLLKAVAGEARLANCISLSENTCEGLAPAFQRSGFIKPERVPLFEDGGYEQALISPRSAKEYGTATNGANDHEHPESLDLGPGDLAQSDVLGEMGTGIYVNNLWYLNYSDRPNCRVTGMTRFATFWAENGQIVAPINVMRFDETLYRTLGTQLVGLTQERDFLPDAGTYERRSTSSTRMPGALIDGFSFTL